MDGQKITKLRAMIQKADFLNSETKQVFLDKIPYLSEQKFKALYLIFNEDLKKRQKLQQAQIELFEKYKTKVTGIYHKAKQLIINLKEKTANKLEAYEIKHLNQELNRMG